MVFSENVINSKRVYCNILLYRCHCYLITFKIRDYFIRSNASFAKKLNIQCREFQLILRMIAMEINLTITMTYLQLEKRIMHYRNLSKQIV